MAKIILNCMTTPTHSSRPSMLIDKVDQDVSEKFRRRAKPGKKALKMGKRVLQALMTKQGQTELDVTDGLAGVKWSAWIAGMDNAARVRG